MTSATVACMRSSRPRPGPMTREWRWASMAMTGVARVEGVEWKGDSCMRGWTIRLGE